MATSVVSKGTVLQYTISAAFATIPNLKSVSHSGAENVTYSDLALDSSVGVPYKNTGFSEGGSYEFEIWLDPSHATHQFTTDLITTPAGNAMKAIFSDSTEETFTGLGITWGWSTDLQDGVSGSGSAKVDGIPTYA